MSNAWWEADDTSSNRTVSTASSTSSFARVKYGATKPLSLRTANVDASKSSLLASCKELGDDESTVSNPYLQVAVAVTSRSAKPVSSRSQRASKSSIRAGRSDVPLMMDTLEVVNDISPTKERKMQQFDPLTVHTSAVSEIRKLKKVPLMKARIASRMCKATIPPVPGLHATSASVQPVRDLPPVSAAPPVMPIACAGTGTDVEESDDEAIDFLPELNVGAARASMAAAMRRVSLGMPLLLQYKSTEGIARKSSILPYVSSIRPSILTARSSSAMGPIPEAKSDRSSAAMARLGRAVRVSTLDCAVQSSIAVCADARILTLVEHAPGSTCTWDQRFSKALPTIFEMLPCSDLLSVACLVSTNWNKAARTAFSWKVASEMDKRCTRGVADGAVDVPIFQSWNGLLNAFPWGHYLADGAYKQVYKVYNKVLRRLEAISIMDVASLSEGSNLPIVQAEIQVSCLVSELVHNCVCPNFVETYQIFLHSFTPDVHFPWHWGTASNKCPQGRTAPDELVNGGGMPTRPRPTAANGEFQYIRMELCSGGDVENQLRGLESHVEKEMLQRTEPMVGTLIGSLTTLRLGTAAARAVEMEPAPTSTPAMASWIVHSFFQMVVSMFASRSRLHLRHYDIKCLNFFVLPTTDTSWMQGQSADKHLCLRYQFGPLTFTLDCVPRLPWLKPGVVKLADFGTADTNAASLGKPIKAYHITTVENSPPEFALCGSSCTQAYSIDTWALGLCFFHLLTGVAPYEEIMESVVCPDALFQKLRLIWEGERFRVLWPFLEDEDDRTMYDTLYRFFVLAVPDTTCRTYMCGSDVGKLLWSLVDGAGCDLKAWKIPAQSLAKCKKLYQEHTNMFSIRTGRHPLLVRARERLACITGGMETLLHMMNWDPAVRPTMKSLLCSEIFASLLKDEVHEDHVVAEFALDTSSSLDDVADV